MTDGEFVLNDDAYAAMDLGREPRESLLDLYVRRARELRDSYGYLVLMYSGGSDSHQALRAFERAGVTIDEGVVSAPVACVETPDTLAWEYHDARRSLEESPTVRSTRVVDVVPEILEAHADPAWLERWAPTDYKASAGTYHMIRRTREARVLEEAHGRRPSVGIVYGAEKPYVGIEGDWLYFYFASGACNGAHHAAMGHSVRPEMFYWGMPEIVVKQTHVVKRACEGDSELRARVAAGVVPADDVVRLCYPDWDYRWQHATKSRDEGLVEAVVGPEAARALRERKRSHYADKYGVALDATDAFPLSRTTRRHYVGRVLT